MTTFPNSPRLIKGGIVLIDPDTGLVQRVIALQYNPDTLTRTLQVQGAGAQGADRTSTAVQVGLLAQLAALETIIYPTSDQLLSTNRLARTGTLEIAPMEAP